MSVHVLCVGEMCTGFGFCSAKFLSFWYRHRLGVCLCTISRVVSWNPVWKKLTGILKILCTSYVGDYIVAFLQLISIENGRNSVCSLHVVFLLFERYYPENFVDSPNSKRDNFFLTSWIIFLFDLDRALLAFSV